LTRTTAITRRSYIRIMKTEQVKENRRRIPGQEEKLGKSLLVGLSRKKVGGNSLFRGRASWKPIGAT